MVAAPFGSSAVFFSWSAIGRLPNFSDWKNLNPNLRTAPHFEGSVQGVPRWIKFWAQNAAIDYGGFSWVALPYCSFLEIHQILKAFISPHLPQNLPLVNVGKAVGVGKDRHFQVRLLLPKWMRQRRHWWQIFQLWGLDLYRSQVSWKFSSSTLDGKNVLFRRYWFIDISEHFFWKTGMDCDSIELMGTVSIHRVSSTGSRFRSKELHGNSTGKSPSCLEDCVRKINAHRAC